MRRGAWFYLMPLSVLCAASAASGHEPDAQRAAYEAARVPALAEALREAAAAPPLRLRVGKRAEESAGEQVRLKLEVFAERAEQPEHTRALELVRLYGQGAWAPGAPTRGHTPVHIMSGGQRHSHLIDAPALRAAGLHEPAPGLVMRERLGLLVRWLDMEGALLDEQLIVAAVSPSCAGLPLTSLCAGCGEGLEIGATLRKQRPDGAVVEVPGCALEIEATLDQERWAKTAQLKITLAGDEDAAMPPVRAAWRELLPPAAAQGVCAITRRKGGPLASWRYDASGRPVEQRGWGTQSGSKRFVYAAHQLREVWDGPTRVERVIYGQDGRLLGTWRGQRRCEGDGAREVCEEVEEGRSVWVVMPDGGAQRLRREQGRWSFEEGAPPPAPALTYVLERRAGAWEAVATRGAGAARVHEVLRRDVLERESFARLTTHKKATRLRVQVEGLSEDGGAMRFEAVISAHDAQDRPLDGVYVEHRADRSRVAPISHDMTSCHKKHAPAQRIMDK